MSKAQAWMLVALAAGIPLSIQGALYPQNTWLQVGPVIAALPVFLWALRRCPVSDAAAGGACVFLLLHLVAARWSYSFTPYQDWGRALGLDVNAVLGAQRNMFDRLIHISFGLLVSPLIAECAERYGRLSRRWAVMVAVLGVFAVSSLYEIFEWSLTMTLSPAEAGAYNGEQGDIYDGQKDMACANLAALLMVPVLLFRRLPRER
ncbi:DUF2238 domain-containing protein [Novosphingobium sp. FSY-8]|uniref:DUF2238 domain-containing protein n=1 Tax=Novosphingobium ovatum TaxID=1908523 RepID=A0ABW9XBM0_9SPHN|nr:DUF2238 domain-containing protein [Novosphingobium ovatum]NBC35923.1 DUF2238 domain-containing protein [Novosphingobium ovatum]